MNIEFKPITTENYIVCIDLKVAPEQDDFVAPNMYSLAQAAYEPELYPLGIYKDGVMVGFFLYDFDYDTIGWSMSRFMIDYNYQNQGIGSVALGKFIQFFYKKHGQLTLHTSANVNNLSTIRLYEKFGFVKGKEFSYESGGKTYREIALKLEGKP